jgi:hypothetical protein
MATARNTSKNKKNVKNEELAHALLSWAKQHKVEDDPYILGLHGALMENSDLAMWSTLVPLEYLPLTETAAGSREISLNHLLTIARNILVFVPVALTWAAVGKATTAFAIYVEANPNSVTNFLEFWQNGYGVLGEKWTIGYVANLDFLLITAVILLTMETSYLSRKGLKIRRLGQRKVDAERMKLGLALTEFLYTKRAVTPSTLNQTVSTSSASLRNASKSLEKNMAAHNKAVASFEKKQK